MNSLWRQNLMQAMECNFISYARRRHGLAGCTFMETDLLSRSSHPTKASYCNRIFRFNHEQANLDAAVTSILDEYRENGCSVTWHVGCRSKSPGDVCQSLLSKGLTEVPNLFTGMVLESNQQISSSKGQSLRVERATTREQIRDWMVPFKASFLGSDTAAIQYYETMMSEAVGRFPEEGWFIGYENDISVTSAGFRLDSEVICIYSVSTHPDFRRRGYAEMITRSTIEHALQIKQVPVVLYSTPMALPLYRQMGFVEVYGYRNFLYKPV